MNNKVFLATTALNSLWDKNADKIIFLGEWCNLYNETSEYKNLNCETLDYIWKDEDEIDKGIEYCEEIYQRLLSNFSNILNNYHKTDKDLRYWDILLKPWLLTYIQILFDRYKHIKLAISKYPNLYTNAINKKNYQFIITPSFFNENIVNSDEYNLQLYSQIIDFLGINHIDINYPMKKIDTEMKIKSSIKEKILAKVSKVLNIIFNKESVLVVSPYFKDGSLRKIFELSIKSKFLFIFDNFKYDININVNPDLDLRKLLFKDINIDDEFMNLLTETLIYNFPMIYLEVFKDFNYQVNILPVKTSKVIYSANAIHHNEIFKFYTANHYKTLIKTYGQHGGNIGIDKVNIPEVIEQNFADIYFTFGWKEQNTKVLSLFYNKNHLTRNNANKITLVMTALPRFFYRFVYQEDSSKMLDYIDNTKMFLSNFKYIDKLTIRPYMQDYNWNIKDRLLEINQNLKFDNHTNYYDQIRDSKLVIFDHMHTGYLETLSMNIPTIIIIPKNIYYFRESAKPYIQMLKDAKILFEDPIKASIFVNDIYDNLDLWWQSTEVQKAREKFCHQYAKTSKKWASEWVKEFNSILENYGKN